MEYRYQITIDSGKGGTITRNVVASHAYNAAKIALTKYASNYTLNPGRVEAPNTWRFEAYDLANRLADGRIISRSLTIWVKKELSSI